MIESMVSNELRNLIAEAGRRKATEDAKYEQERRDAEVRAEEERIVNAASLARAREAAAAIFAWADGHEGSELRALMREAGIEQLPLNSYDICLVQEAGELRVWRHGCGAYGGAGRVDANVTSAEEVVRVVRAEQIEALAEVIRTGRLLDQIASVLHVKLWSGRRRTA